MHQFKEKVPAPTCLASGSRVAREAGAGVGLHAAPAVLATFAAHRCVIKSVIAYLSCARKERALTKFPRLIAPLQIP